MQIKINNTSKIPSELNTVKWNLPEPDDNPQFIELPCDGGGEPCSKTISDRIV